MFAGVGDGNLNQATLDEALIAEARFFRAFDYFQLVQTFGGVPLDLGSGELKFNTSPVRTSARNTVPEVYTKASSLTSRLVWRNSQTQAV